MYGSSTGFHQNTEQCEVLTLHMDRFKCEGEKVITEAKTNHQEDEEEEDKTWCE